MKIKKDFEVNKYLVVCDLDGTLLNVDGELSPRTIKTIERIKEMGNIVCLATGRTKNNALRFYQQLKLNTLMSNLDGAIISNPSDVNFPSLNFTFNRNILLEIYNNQKIMSKTDLAIVETGDSCVFLNQTKEVNVKKDMELLNFLGFRADKKDSDFNDVIFNGQISDVKSDLYALLLVLKDDKNVDEIANRIKDIAGTLNVLSWTLKETNEIVVCISSIFASKLTALKYFSSYYGIKLENCIVFGDSSNDVPMLTKAGYSFAMKNGNMSAKLASKYITRLRNFEDGVATELEKLFFLHDCELDIH